MTVNNHCNRMMVSIIQLIGQYMVLCKPNPSHSAALRLGLWSTLPHQPLTTGLTFGYLANGPPDTFEAHDKHIFFKN